jgi:hypothetical protein
MAYYVTPLIQLDVDALDANYEHCTMTKLVDPNTGGGLAYYLTSAPPPPDELLPDLPASLRLRRMGVVAECGYLGGCLILEKHGAELMRRFEPSTWSHPARTISLEDHRILDVKLYFVAPPALPRTIDIIDYARSETKTEEIQGVKIVLPKSHQYPSLALKKEFLVGLNFWKSAGAQFRPALFCSDAFKEAWCSEIGEGFNFTYCQET